MGAMQEETATRVACRGRYRRRLLRAFVRSTGSIDADGGTAAWFDGVVAAEIDRLPPSLRSAATLALQSEDEDCTALARRLTEIEGRPVSAVALRQRVSRALRRLERGLEVRVRRQTGSPDGARPDEGPPENASRVHRDGPGHTDASGPPD